jgi:glycyl-tRNA synthetase beta subunit
MNDNKAICAEILEKIEKTLKEPINIEEGTFKAELEKVEKVVYDELMPNKEYLEILKLTATLTPSLNNFIDNNYIFDNNILSRERKLKLIERTRKLFTLVADFSI